MKVKNRPALAPAGPQGNIKYRERSIPYIITYFPDFVLNIFEIEIAIIANYI